VRIRRSQDPTRTPRLQEEATDARPDALLARLQQSSGNAAVARMLARRAETAAPGLDPEAPPPGPGIEPHPPGQDRDTPQALEQDEVEGTIALDETETTAAPEPVTTRGQPADPAIVAWQGRQVATNPEYAQWILDAERHGFVTFAYNSKRQLQSYAAGRRHAMTGNDGGHTEIGGTIDPTSATVLPVLETTHGIVSARAGRWVQDTSKPKQPLTVLWLARNWGGDAHSSGRSLDAAGGIDFGSSRAGAQVVQILADLPTGSYWIGLPYQRPFFDVMDSLLHYTNDAEREAARTGTDPADVTTEGLVEWRLVGYTARWNTRTRKWDQTQGSLQATEKIQDASVRAALAGGNGKTFATFPDRPNHIHIQRV
jgi:hypothetical protein